MTAASAKAARLINGHTVHSAFKLQAKGGFLETQLDGGKKHTKHWAWLYTRDVHAPFLPFQAAMLIHCACFAQVIIIDEVSMLTAGTMHGVNHALNHVMSLTASAESSYLFGHKSMIAVGDLFQLPAVEKHRFREQAPAASMMHAPRHSTGLACNWCGRSTSPRSGQLSVS